MNQKRVIIIDDDAALASALAIRCRSIGLHTQICSDGLSGLMSIQRHTPDLIILDINMPVDGLQVCERLANDPVLSRIPIIFLSGQADTSTIAKCESLGADHVFKGLEIWSDIGPLIFKHLSSVRSPELAFESA